MPGKKLDLNLISVFALDIPELFHTGDGGWGQFVDDVLCIGFYLLVQYLNAF